MSDTVFFNKIKITAVTKAALIYLSIDVCISLFVGVGQTLFELSQEEWNSWWTAQKLGWVMLQVGGVLSSAFLTVKAFFSNSSKENK